MLGTWWMPSFSHFAFLFRGGILEFRLKLSLKFLLISNEMDEVNDVREMMREREQENSGKRSRCKMKSVKMVFWGKEMEKERV
jgi:hypothetical protein